MEKELKELLLIDLCARLPYGVESDCVGEYVKIKYIDPHRSTVYISNLGKTKWESIEVITPYLRPMSSMTEEEKQEYHNLCYEEEREELEYGEWVTRVYFHDTLESYDFLNSIHIDYRGLIEKGLAIEVTEENNPYKE